VLTAPRLVLLLALAVTTLAPPLAAREDCKRNQDCALEAFQRGDIKPLSEVLVVARTHVPGEVVKIELDREDGVWVYEIRVLTASGRIRKLEIDAKSLAVIKVK
jgi:uncharacterized membrane protein YkoI